MARKVAQVLSHWNHFFDGLSSSSQAFYQTVESAVKARELPDIKVDRVDFREGGIFSAKREYLRVEHKELLFDVCAAPFGTGYFFSWWLGEPAPDGLWGMIISIPYLGVIAQKLFRPMTYYSKDTALMVQSAIHNVILEVIDSMTAAKGLRALTELERKPIMKDLFG
jgi:hypothetical protein